MTQSDCALLSWACSLLAMSAITSLRLAAFSSRVLNLLLMFFNPCGNNISEVIFFELVSAAKLSQKSLYLRD